MAQTAKIVGGLLLFVAITVIGALAWGWLIMLGWGILHHEAGWPDTTIGLWPATGLGLIVMAIAGVFRSS